MNGKIVSGGLVGFTLIFGAALWWSQTRAYYYEVNDLTEITAYGDAFPVSDYRGIDADTSPLKMRACFTVDWDYWPSEEFIDIAHPLIAPPQFDCFDAVQITNDIASGDAVAILAQDNDPYGFDRFIAQYPDGRAFMWRQINACGDATFSGETPPDHCPPKPEIE